MHLDDSRLRTWKAPLGDGIRVFRLHQPVSSRVWEGFLASKVPSLNEMRLGALCVNQVVVRYVRVYMSAHTLSFCTPKLFMVVLSPHVLNT